MNLLKQLLMAIGTGNLLVHVCADVEYYSSPADGYGGSQSKKPPVILVHKQAMSHDGTFNVAFAGDNGIQQGETIHADGTRVGAYSYVDPSGETISLEYRAGKDGFKITRADHIPKAVIASVSPAATVQSASGTKYPASFDGLPSSLPSQLSTVASSDEHSYDSGLGPTASYSHHRAKVNTNFRPDVDRAHEQTNAANYPQPAPTYAALRHREAAVNDGYRIADPVEPHSFGNGYSFEFGAAANES